jgi:hypothetical protein
MSDTQLKLGAAPVDVDGPAQQNTRLSPEVLGDPSVNVEWYLERAHQLPLTLLSALVLSTTNGDSGTAGNYSRDKHHDYATRYGRELEHVTVARGLSDQHGAANGREPGEVLIMPGLTVPVADTDEEAIRPQEPIHPAKDFAKTLAELGRAFGRLDFSQHDLDAPFPAEAVKYGQNSFRTHAEKIALVASEENLSLRETVLYFERRILNRSPAPPRPSPTRSSAGCGARRTTAS